MELTHLEGLDRTVAYLQLMVKLLAENGYHPSSMFADISESRARAILQHDEALVAAFHNFRTQILADWVLESVASWASIAYHITRPLGSFPAPVPPPPTDEKPARLVRGAWDTRLVGSPDIKLVQAMQVSISAGPGEGNHYANTVTMLQSSGTGKTRSAHEASKFVVSYPIILRPGSGPEFPRADVSMRTMMSARVAEDLQGHVYPNRFRHTIRLLSSYLLQWLKLQTWTEVTQPRAYWEKASAWNLFLAQHRTQLYDAVVDRVSCMEQAYCRFAQNRTSDQTVQVDAAAWHDEESHRAKQALVGLCHILRDPVGDDERVIGDDEVLPDQFKYVLSDSDKKNVRLAVDGLVARWVQVTKTPISHFWSENKNLLVLVYFDEAHILLPTEDEWTRERSLYDHLLSVLNDLAPEIFGLFLSTSSYLHQFAPPAELSASARQANSKFLQPPITEVPWDCMPLIRSKEVTLKDLGTIAFLAGFGRLLFWTILQSQAAQKMEKGYAELYVMRLAMAKLTAMDRVDIDIPSRYSETAHIAVMSVRYLFDYEPHVFLSAKQAIVLVARHMSVVYGVPVHRLFMFSGYSSEPILSEAAAWLMRAWTWDWSSTSSTGPIPTGWSPLGKLSELISNSMLDYGGRGELVARYLFITAYDHAMVALHSTTRGWLFSAGCPVKQFIESLFASPTAEEVLDSRPDNIAGHDVKTFGEVFARAYVRFTHFVRLQDGCGLTTRGLAGAFIRGMAYVAKVGQMLVDIIIPVLLDRSQPPTPDNMSCILVQVKRRIRAGTPAMYDFTAEQLGVFEDSDPKPEDGAVVDAEAADILPRPYIALLLELGVKSKETHEGASDAPPAPVTQQAKAKAPANAKVPAYAALQSDAAPSKTSAASSKTVSKAAAGSTKSAASAATSAAAPTTKSASASKQKLTAPPAPSTSTIATRSVTKARGPASATGATASGSTSTGTGPVMTPPKGATTQRGVYTGQGDRTTPSRVTIPKGPDWQSPRRPKPHPRYNVRVYGCSDKVYGVISPNDRHLLEDILLVKYTMVEKHPRKDRIADMLRMKPFWTAKSFHWSDHPPLVEEWPPLDMNDASVDVLQYPSNQAEDEDVEVDD